MLKYLHIVGIVAAMVLLIGGDLLAKKRVKRQKKKRTVFIPHRYSNQSTMRGVCVGIAATVPRKGVHVSGYSLIRLTAGLLLLHCCERDTILPLYFI